MPERLPRRVLVAPDKFKGSLTAVEAAEAIARGLRRSLPSVMVDTLPFADGGEGTVDAVVAAGGTRHTATVSGPDGEPVSAHWALLGRTAVIEMAQASGLQLTRPSPARAASADTHGTGELISAALDAGVETIVVGVGGSATTDAGAGALRALGVRFLDEAGRDVEPGGFGLRGLAAIDSSRLDPRLAGTGVVLCSDVANPFCGPGGAAVVFGPQKGADATTVAELDVGLARFADVVRSATGVDLRALEWGGAGGGIAGGLRAFLGAEARDGVDVLAELVDLDARLARTDLVVVGEGSLDSQSVLGKAPVGVAKRAQRLGVPAIAICGRTDFGPRELAAQGIAEIVAVTDLAPSMEQALTRAAEYVEQATALACERVGAGVILGR